MSTNMLNVLDLGIAIDPARVIKIIVTKERAATVYKQYPIFYRLRKFLRLTVEEPWEVEFFSAEPSVIVIYLDGAKPLTLNHYKIGESDKASQDFNDLVMAINRDGIAQR